MRCKSAAGSSAEWSLGGKGRRASALLSSRLKTWPWSGRPRERRVRIVQPGVSHRLLLVTPESSSSSGLWTPRPSSTTSWSAPTSSSGASNSELPCLSFFLSASSPIHAHCHHLVTSADTVIGAKICQNTSILWNIRLYNSLRTSWSGYVGEMMHDKDLQLDQKRTWLTLMLPADTWSWVEELFWATESKLVGLHYTSIQCTDGLTVGVWAAIIALLSSISCCYPDPTIHLAFNSFYLTWCLSYWWQDLSIKKFCAEQGLMGCRHFCWLFLLFQSNFISSARSAF